MSSSKIDRAKHGPGWVEVIIGALLSMLLGAVLGFAYLVTKPVATVRELPKEKVAGQVYYLEGSKDGRKGQTWLRKRQAFLEGQSVELTEDELNTALTTPTEKPKEGTAAPAAAKPPPAADALFVPGSVNFRLADDQLQIGLPVKCPLLGLTILVQAAGGFEKAGDTFRFAPRTFYVGSCPVHRVPIVESIVLKRVFAGQAMPDDLAAAWKKLTDAKVEGRVLKLQL